ncbi:peptidylprolyl isomerase [Nanoarchaeota archaeon]
MPVKDGHKVKIHYTGKLDDGTVFDSSEGREPLEFVTGKKMVIPGFEKAVVGMEKDEEKEVKIEPKDAYGDKNPQMVQKIPKDKLPPEAKEGSMLMMGLPNGQQMPVKITKMDDKEAELDMNHPLAGKTLNFKITMVDFKEATEEDCKECGPGSCEEKGCGCGQ